MNQEQYLKGLKSFNESQKREAIDFSECERVLGNTQKVADFANFWETHADDFLTLGAKELFEFSSVEEYTKREKRV